MQVKALNYNSNNNNPVKFGAKSLPTNWNVSGLKSETEKELKEIVKAIKKDPEIKSLINKLPEKDLFNLTVSKYPRNGYTVGAFYHNVSNKIKGLGEMLCVGDYKMQELRSGLTRNITRENYLSEHKELYKHPERVPSTADIIKSTVASRLSNLLENVEK